MRNVRNQLGQATAEYALVIVAAATVALSLIVWASTTNVLPDFFTAIIEKVISMAGGGGDGSP
jgi:hypothetical protein